MSDFEEKFWRQFGRMKSKVESVSHDMSGGHPLPGFGTFSPPADVLETDKGYIARVDIAGVDPGELELVLQDRVLYLIGQRRVREGGRFRVHQMEIRFGPFRKAIPLPGPVDADSVRSRYEQGMLIVEIDKPEPRKVEVRIE